MYFFSSKRAKLRVSGGFFDSHKAGKSLRLVNALWLLNLFQFIFVLISPSVFGVALYNGLKNGAKFSNVFNWSQVVVFGGIDADVIVTAFYLLVYALWTYNAYHVKVIHRYATSLTTLTPSSLVLSFREARFQSGNAV